MSKSPSRANLWRLLSPAQRTSLQNNFVDSVKKTLDANFIDRIRGKDEEIAKKLFAKVLEHAPPYSKEAEEAIIRNIPEVLSQHKDSIKKSGLSDQSTLQAVALSIASKATKEDQEKATSRRFTPSKSSPSIPPIFPTNPSGSGRESPTPQRVPALNLSKITGFEFDAEENSAKGYSSTSPGNTPRTDRSSTHESGRKR